MLEVKDSGIHWMEPRDWTIDEIMKRVDDAGLGALGPYSEGINVLRADLACETLDPAMDRESLRRRLTAADD
jgi:hypothetical protein